MSPDAPEIETVRRGRWFASLPPPLQTRIARLGVLRRFRTGPYLLREGDPPRGMFGLVTGRTRHICRVGEEREVLMHVGGPGPWTGEYSMLSGARSIGSVIADEPTQALQLSASSWRHLVEEDPRWLHHFAALMADRFATAFRAYADAQGLMRDDWVHSRLRQLAFTRSNLSTDSGGQGQTRPTTLRLTDVEQVFKKIEQDLTTRTNFHKTEVRIEVHIFVAFLSQPLRSASAAAAAAA